MIERVLVRLTGERGPLLLALLATLLALPALRLGYQADDHMLSVLVERGQPVWDLFSIDGARVAEGREVGATAWWASPRLEGHFLRPVSSALLGTVISIAPSAPWLLLLWNVLVYGACAWFAALLYQKLAPSPAIAALAGLMFAIDDGHAHSVGWISGGNTIMALLFALSTLWFHIRARETGKAIYTAASALSVALALGSGEAGAWSLTYLIAYAVALDDRSYSMRLRSLLPHALIGAAWAAIYVGGHYGIQHSSWYQPLFPPGQALANGLGNLPLTITSLFGPSVIAFSIFFPIWKARVALLPVAVLLLWLVVPQLRASRTSRFFALLTALATFPLFLTVPQDRVLIGSGFGAFGWIAAVLDESGALSDLRHRIARVVLRGCHIWMAAVLFIPMLADQYRFELAADALLAKTRPGRITVLLNTPIELLAMYVGAKAQRATPDPAARPVAVHQLYSGASELIAERTSERAIELTATRGWGYVPLERIFCAPEDMPRAGDERRVRGMTIRTLATNPAGMPERVRFTFEEPLESGAIDWLVWTDAGHPVPWQPPGVGQRSRIAPLDLLNALPQ